MKTTHVAYSLGLPQAKGAPGLGPDLTDNTWLHGDGSEAFLRTIIRSGVTKPKKSTAVMPPAGGGNLNASLQK